MSIEYIQNTPASPYYLQNRNECKQWLASQPLRNVNIVLKFSASWCGPCSYSTLELKKTIDTILSRNNQQNTFTKKIIILDFDVDADVDIASYYRISTLPTVITVYNNEREQVANSMSSAEWMHFIQKLH